MTFGVITKVVEHRIRYKFCLKEYLIHLTVLEIERQEWGALSRMMITLGQLWTPIHSTIYKVNYLLKILVL
jgi:hypothetical protein